MSQEVTIDTDEVFAIHDPYRSKPFSINEVITDNLKLRQKLNEQEKHYEIKLSKAEHTKEKAIKERNEAREDYNALLVDYVKLKHRIKELEEIK